MNAYRIYVTTSNIKNAGTNANVYIKLIGRTSESDKLILKDSKTNSNPFEAGKTDVFEINYHDVGRLKKIKIGHDNKGLAAGWHLKEVIVESQLDGRRWFCDCNKWLAKDEDDGKIERELLAIEQPKLKSSADDNFNLANNSSRSNSKNDLYSNDSGGGTYKVYLEKSNFNITRNIPNLFIQLFGNMSKTAKIPLKEVQIERNKLQRDEMADEFEINLPNLGNIDKLWIGFDPRTSDLGWHLSNVIVESPDGVNWIFECNQWLDKNKRDGKIERTFLPTKVLKANKNSNDFESSRGGAKDEIYKVYVKTSDVDAAGTDANVYIQIIGKHFKTDKINLKTSKLHKNKFERGQTDYFEIRDADVGNIEMIKMGHDNHGIGPGWHLNEVTIEKSDNSRWIFPCNKWLDKKEGDGKIERDLYPIEQIRDRSRKDFHFIEKEVDYEVYVKTSDIQNAGTDANVYIKIYGDVRTSNKIGLDKSSLHNNKFERGNTDRFSIRELFFGDIHKIKIGHDDKGIGSNWHLNEVIIECIEVGKRWVFPCNRWIGKDKEDGRSEVELVPSRSDTDMFKPTKKYTIEVYTGDLPKAGTDANVYLKIYGENGESSELHLENSQTHMNKFERNHMDRFEIEEADIGQLFGVKVRHDNSGILPDWFLDRIEIKCDDNRYKFICEKWFSLERDDRRIERLVKEINYQPNSRKRYPSKKKRTEKKKKVAVEEYIALPKHYYIKFYTGNKQSILGTDMNVYIRLFGDFGISQFFKLSNSKTHENKFNRDQIDLFVFEAFDDHGTIYAIELKFEECLKSSNDLHVEKVEVRDETFNYEFHLGQFVSIKNISERFKSIIILEKSAEI